MRLFIAALVILASMPAVAHDSWISKGGYRNAAGEWCCGEKDCKKIPVVRWENGFVVDGQRHLYDEFTPSPDGEVWVCYRTIYRPDFGGLRTIPDRGGIRCLFGPQPGS